MAVELDSAGQYALLALALASVTYIRSVPYSKLVEKIIIHKTKNEKIPHSVLFQTAVLDLMQLAFVAISVLLIGRDIIWNACYDEAILWAYFILVSVFALLHLWINGRGIIKAYKAWFN